MYPLLLHNKKNIWRILKCSKNYHIKMVKQIHQKLGEKFKIESEISGFQVKQVRTIPELQLTAFSLKHLNTGADYLHIARDDSNNVFCVGFRTTPMDSTGVPHILEHTVLCGSEKFPCRDPFFKMLNRSLSTFMNAMTGSDYTIYPFSTQHPVDFKNLMEVYLDAVFKPNLTELDFFQEGWRLEHENPDDKSSPLIFKGVVFNEMKGVFTDSQQRFCQKLQNELFPSHTYGYISGGDPLTIPKLSWRDLRKFHANHYHPSNSRFFTYGNFPLEDHLEFIHNNYLSKFEKIITNTNVPDEPRWNKSRRTDITCGIDPMTQKDRESSVAVSFLLASIQDIPENFTLAIIGDLLMNGPNAPFYKSLIESQYGTNFTASSGFDGSTRTTSFTVGLQGVKRNNLNEVVNRIENTFNEVISEGFPQERIDAVLHNIELGLKHQTTTFGLNLAMNLTPLWNHDGDIIAALEINKNLDNFKKSLSNNPNYLQDKLNKYFKINKHKLILTMSPNADFDNEIKESEKNLLENKIEHLNDVHKENIWNLGQVLKSQQEAKQDTSCLPSLQISDLTSRIQPIITVDNKFDNGVPFQLCEQPTNGVTYFRLLLNTNEIPEHLREFIPLFCDVLTKMGAGDLDFRTLSQKIELISGGLYANVHVTEHPQNLGKYEEGILLSSHCLQSNLDRMLDLWKKILNEIKFDDIARFDSLVKMIATEEANELVYKGHSYAMSYAASSVNFISHMKEQWSGLTHLQRLKALSESSDLSNILNKLKEMSEILLSSNKIRVAINTSPEISDKTISTVGKFMQNIRVEDTERSSMTEIPSSFQPYTCRTHHVFPFPINFAAKSFSSLPYSHPDSASLRVLARLMFQFLHREIREKGGAYGGGAISSPGGPFYFYSYRDPHSTQTFKIFDDAVEYILSGDFTQQDVDEAKLGVFQKVDEPIAPGSKGMRKFLHHISDDMFMDHRSNIINTDSQDLIRVCRTYLREANMEGACLIGPKNEMLEEDPFWNTQVHGQSES